MLVKTLMAAMIGHLRNPHDGMYGGNTFMRKFGKKTRDGKQIVVLVTMIAIPKAQLDKFMNESLSPTVAYCEDGEILLGISGNEAVDISKPSDAFPYARGSMGGGIDNVIMQPIWRFR